jgi:CRP/FNR family transcriptional regulator, cyclic AMP receptor protein
VRAMTTGSRTRIVASPLLDVLDEADRRELVETARRRRFDRDEVVFHVGDPADSLQIILSGRVSIRRTIATGDRAILGYLGPGEFFGELALIGEAPEPRNATVRTVEPTETLAIAGSRFAELRRRRPAVDRFLTEVLAHRVRELDDRLVEALLVQADSRVVRRLLDLAAPPGPDGVAVATVTQEDLAAASGTSRATVNRVLRDAEKAGVLRLGRGRVEVLDADALTRLGP